MHIFIDESGTFTPGADGDSCVSAVGALVVPTKRLRELERRWSQLRKTLPMQDGEVKGRMLDEQQIAAVCCLLFDHECIFEVDVFEGLFAQGSVIDDAKEAQAIKLTASLTDQHHESIWKWLTDLQIQVRKMPNQLFVQFKLLTHLIAKTLNHATTYYVQRRPDEISSFHWRIDAKGKDGITSGEQWWRETVMPFLQSNSERNPLIILEGADYSHFKRFDSRIGDHLLPLNATIREKIGTNMNLVMTEDFAFSSDIVPGLELVDIVTNASRRALKGNLDRQGWRAIRRLMIHRREQYIGMVSFDLTTKLRPLPYLSLLHEFKSGGRNMLVPDRQWRRRR